MGYRRRTPPECNLCACGDHAWAPLTRGYVTMVSPEDASHLRAFHWAAIPKPAKNKPYGSPHDRVTAVRSINGRGTVMLHRDIMQPSADMLVDHKNRNPLDNRRRNLRLAKTFQNNGNARRPTGRKASSRFKGVTWDKHAGKWNAAIEVDGCCKNLGLFEDEAHAGEAYRVAAVERYGEFARFDA